MQQLTREEIGCVSFKLSFSVSNSDNVSEEDNFCIGSIFKLCDDKGNTFNWSSTTKHLLHEARDNKNLSLNRPIIF